MLTYSRFFSLTFAPEFEKQTHAGMLISMFVINVLFAQSNLHILIVFWKYILFFFWKYILIGKIFKPIETIFADVSSHVDNHFSIS